MAEMHGMRPGATATDMDHAAIAERYLRAIGDRDFDTVLGIFAEDVVGEWPQSGERFRGKQACLNVYANYPGGSPKVLGTPTIKASGDLVVSQAEMEYPDGKRWLAVSILEFRDGKIAHETDYFAERFPAPEWRMQWVDRD